MALFMVSTVTAIVVSTITRKKTSSKNKKIAWIAVGVTFVLAVLFMPPTDKTNDSSAKPSPTITITKEPKPENPLSSWKKYNVNWAEYGEGMQDLIAETYNKKDCQTLQGFFDMTAQDNGNHAAKFGHNNANLMKYIANLLEKAGCYKK